MRKYTRKPIRLVDVSPAARTTITMPKRGDEIDEQVERLKASGWLTRREEPVADDTDFVGFTYTGLSFPSTAKPKRKDKSHDVVVVKRKRELGERTERRGKIFTNRNGFAD